MYSLVCGTVQDETWQVPTISVSALWRRLPQTPPPPSHIFLFSAHEDMEDSWSCLHLGSSELFPCTFPWHWCMQERRLGALTKGLTDLSSNLRRKPAVSQCLTSASVLSTEVDRSLTHRLKGLQHLFLWLFHGAGLWGSDCLPVSTNLSLTHCCVSRLFVAEYCCCQHQNTALTSKGVKSNLFCNQSSGHGLGIQIWLILNSMLHGRSNLMKFL